MTSSYLSIPAPYQPFEMMNDPGTHSCRYTMKASDLTMMRYLQDLHQAETPAPTPQTPKYHTGRLPNSRAKDGKPSLMLMGQKRSGKSSISSVVFHKLPPSETLYLDTTTHITKYSLHYDDTYDGEATFGEIDAIIWVIDAQDEYLDAIDALNDTILTLQTRFPTINVEVFVHKVDGLSDDYKSDTFRDIIQRVQDELSDAGYNNAPVSFYQTSIFDDSIFEAFSKVIQKLIPQLPTLETLLNNLCSKCQMEKAYLFDMQSKIYIATDTSPTDISSYEICSGYIDMVVDISEIFGWDRPADSGEMVDQGIQEGESLVTMGRRGNSYLYLREINKYLALICLMGEESSADKKVLIDYNVSRFKEALLKVFPGK
ncbi:ras-related GTP-binding protein-like protein C [Cryomyces antarcticus]